MYLAFYNLKHKPFQITTDPKFLWLGEKHEEALATLKYGILDNKGFLLLTGDVGTGKTTLINALLKTLEKDVLVASIRDPALDAIDFFNYTAHAFGMKKKFTSKGAFLIQFESFLQHAYQANKKVLLIIDEAQRITQEMLEEVRHFSNIETADSKLLNIFSVGQMEFNEILLRPENRAIRQRITVNYHISTLTRKETEEYIQHRLNVAGSGEKIFEDEALDEIFSFSEGYPRLINIICDRSLLTGFVEGAKTITLKHVRECVQELEIPHLKLNKYTARQVAERFEAMESKSSLLPEKGRNRDTSDTNDSAAVTPRSEYSGQAAQALEEAAGKRPARKKKVKRGSGLRLLFRTLGVMVLILAGIMVAEPMVTDHDAERMEQALSNFQQAEQFLADNDYRQAKEALDEASSALNRILFFKKEEKEQLRQKIRAITDSQSFRENLPENVVDDGGQVTDEMAQQIDTFNSQMGNAERLQSSGNIQEALKFYEQARQTARQIGFEEEEKIIRRTMTSLRLKKTLNEARKAEEEKEWKQATDTYTRALKLSENLSIPDDRNEIAARLAAASFRHELAEGQKAFTASEWQKTIEMLQRAQEILEDNPQIASEAEKAEIQKLLINSTLYHILSGAKKAFDKKEWELAANQYKNAIYLLENNKKIIGDKAAASISKIEKTILMTEIAKEQSEYSMAYGSNDRQASLQNLRAIASLIEKSSFSKDEALRKILDDARMQMTALENEIRINSRIDWLERNYEEIFRKMYPSAKSLARPTVTFIREEGEKLIFNMSCVEKRYGRSYRLELNYQYDQKEDTWDIYSGTLADNPPPETKTLNAVAAEQAAAREIPETTREISEKLVIPFPANSNIPPVDSLEELNRLVDYLLRQPQYKVIVSGFTDSQGNEGYNQKLSEFRANSVKSYLTGRGLDAARITTQGMGSQNPIESNNTSSGRIANRRVEIEVKR